MNKEEIQNLIKDLIEKLNIKLNGIEITENNPKNVTFSLEVGEPHLFISREAEGLNALNHLVHRIVEKHLTPTPLLVKERGEEISILIDINGFQKKRIENIRAVAHMMSERARYFKSNIEVDPMSAFERRIVHEFLSEATDLKTESAGFGPTRHVVIKYIGTI